MQPPVFTSYQNWLNEQKMPNGKRAALLSALALFSKQGYDGTSTMAIAEHAGISQATIFKYFKTKQDLLNAILLPIISNLLPGYREDFFSSVPENGSLRDIISFFVRDRYAFIQQNSDAVMIAFTQMLTSEMVRNRVRDFMTETSPMYMQSLVARIKQTGELRDDLTPLALFRTVAGQVFAYFLQREKLAPDLQVDENADLDLLTSLIVAAISKWG